MGLFKKRIQEQNTLFVRIWKTIVVVFLAIYCISLLVPLIWMIFTSLKDEVSYTIDNFGFPKTMIFSNYSDVLTKYLYVEQNGFRYGLDVLFTNSLILSFGFATWGVDNILFVAYVISRYNFIGKKFLYNLGLILMVLPIVGTLPATFKMYRIFGIYDNMLMLILTSSTAPFSGMWFLIFYNSFLTIPKDFTEAAEIDGAGYYRIMFQIVMPMIIPVAAVLYVLNFISNWNNYGVCLYWLPSYPNIPYGMYVFQMGATAGSGGAGMTLIMAGFTCVMLPTVLLYIASQKIMNSNFVVGGIKM